METRSATDAQIIEASIARPAVFEEIFDRHFAAMHRFAVGRVGSQEAADVVAETFARAFARRRRFRLDRPSALPWLFGIAVNVCRERSRWVERGQRATTRVATRAEMTTEPFETALAERIDAERMRPDLIVALRGLSDDEYALLMLTSEAGMSYVEMAEHLGIPIGTVRSRLARARKRLRAELATPANVKGEVHVARD